MIFKTSETMESKITVKHYLNTSLNPIVQSGKLEYPIYVQVTYKRKSYKFRSSNNYFEYLSETDLNNDFISRLLGFEIKKVTNVVRLINEHKPKLLTSKNLSFLTKDFDLIIEDNFKKLLVNECKETPLLFRNASYKEINEVLYFLRMGLEDSPEIQGNEKILNVLYGISKMGYSTMSFYKQYYLGIDWFLGYKFHELIDYIESEKNENEIKQLVKDMQDFIKM